MIKILRRIPKVIAFIVCIPLVGTMFVKPDKSVWKQEPDDVSFIDECFAVAVDEDIGIFYYSPEKFTELVMYRMIPEDIVFSTSEDFIAGVDAVRDPEQEYLKALSIVCRSNIVYAWESGQCPDILEYDTIKLEKTTFYKIHTDVRSDDEKGIRLKELQRAAEATKGAVITRENRVIAAPFFTTSASGMLVSEAGDGNGFSLNYAYELAQQGMDFYEILKYFFGDIKVNIYE
ncbi:MAG: SpoIID/LytB domain-containing protein [Lachnospiraceae bacterium]|nr:SpoIID/LytB domain-containing protein [Lachnospiraceae bacterium]